MEKSNIQLSDLEEFAAKHGQRNLNQILNTLGKGTIFIQVLETEIGKELLKESVDRLVELLEVIVDDPFCNEKLRMEFFILRKTCRLWAAKIMKFNKAKGLLKPQN